MNRSDAQPIQAPWHARHLWDKRSAFPSADPRPTWDLGGGWVTQGTHGGQKCEQTQKT